MGANQYTVSVIYPEKSGFTVRTLKPGQAIKIKKFEHCFLRGQVRSNGYFRGCTVEP